jgi:hypothetical protein
MLVTAHQLLSIRRRAPDFAIDEFGPGACRVTLGRAWAVVLLTNAGWEISGPWQLVRDQETLRDRNRLHEFLRELGVIHLQR